MKGLLVKDLFALKQQGKVLLALLAFYVMYSVTFDNLSMLVGMIVLLCVMLPVTTIAYDEKSKWDKYALSMPIEKKTIVLSKYVFAVGAELIGVILVGFISVAIVIFTGEKELGEMVLMTLVIGGIGLFFLAIILPILFKFGVEKARLIMLMVIFIPSMVVMMLPQLGITPPGPQVLKMLGYASPLFLIGLLWISIKTSISIYNRKEF